MRIKFEKEQQEKFINYSLQKLECNLRELADKLKINYPCLKKYHKEICCIPEHIFLKICKASGVNSESLNVSKFPDNLGQIIGGKRGILSMRKKYKNKLRIWRVKGGRNHIRNFKYS